MVYKDIRKVMQLPDMSLVEVLGEFTPKIVRMCGDEFSPQKIDLKFKV
jgi:tRNA-splicing ligase RtcB